MKKVYKNKWAGVGVCCTLMAIVGFAIISGCKKSPKYGIKVIINPDIIKNSMMVQIVDAYDNTTIPKNITAAISGADAGNIYETGGTKNFTVTRGALSIGVGPQRVLTDANPAKFNITVSAPGYMPITQALSISASETSQVVRLKLISFNRPPADVKIYQTNVALVDGAVSEQSSFKVFSVSKPSVNAQPFRRSTNDINTNDVDSVYFDDGLTSIVLPKGTTFHYYVEVQTGTVTAVNVVPEYAKVPITLDQGNGSGYYTRLVKYDTIQNTYATYSLEERAVTSDSVKMVAYTTAGQSVPYSVYPYNYYTPFSVQLADGSSVAEDQVLYQTAVQQKITGIGFFAQVNGMEEEVSPDAQYNWFTSFVLNPATINPATNRAIAAGDSIDVGLDVTNHVTLRAVIQKATLTNGTTQLRVQTQTPDAGYYLKANYSSDYTYTFNTAGTLAAVADPDNLSAYGSIKVLTGGNYVTGAEFPLVPNSGTMTFDGKVRSFTPITVQAVTGVVYWGKDYETAPVSGLTGTLDFPSSLNIDIEPKVTLNVTFTCSASSTVYLGVGYASVYGTDGKYGVCNMTNGKWSTNGFTVGQTYTAYMVTPSGKQGSWHDLITRQSYSQLVPDSLSNPGGFCNGF